MSDKNKHKRNKKVGQKTKAELRKMKVETADEVGYSNESKKLGKDKPKSQDNTHKVTKA